MTPKTAAPVIKIKKYKCKNCQNPTNDFAGHRLSETLILCNDCFQRERLTENKPAAHTPTPEYQRIIETLELIEKYFTHNTAIQGFALLNENVTIQEAVGQSLFFARKYVRAVNAHEELVKALEYIAAGMPDSSEKDKFAHAQFYAADALAKAGGLQ